MTMLRFLTAGESHGPCLTAIIEGLPAGLAVEASDIDLQLARRQRGYGRSERMQVEKDRVQILGGVLHGRTVGGPVAIQIANRDWQNWRSNWQSGNLPPVTVPRPGHADLAGVRKYGLDDARMVLERASARETAARVAVGAAVRQLLGHLPSVHSACSRKSLASLSWMHSKRASKRALDSAPFGPGQRVNRTGRPVIHIRGAIPLK